MANGVPHKLIIEERDGYLYVLYGGDPLTLEMIVKTANMVSERVRATGFKKLLVVREAPPLESEENRSMVRAMGRSLLGAGVQLAVIDAYGNDPTETQRVAEVSRQAGWNLAVFDSEEEAEAWLLRDGN